MDRFAAYVLLRQLLRQPEHRQQARAAEAIMETLARRLQQPADQWAMMGLLLHADIELAAHNEQARGRLAREQAETEGLPASLGATLERCWQQPIKPTPLEDALRLAEWLAANRHVKDLAQELRLRRGSGDEQGECLDGALDRLGLTVVEVAALMAESVKQVEQRP